MEVRTIEQGFGKSEQMNKDFRLKKGNEYRTEEQGTEEQGFPIHHSGSTFFILCSSVLLFFTANRRHELCKNGGSRFENQTSIFFHCRKIERSQF